MNGTFVSVWDGGFKIESPCTVDLVTRQVTVPQPQNVNGVKVLDTEYVIFGALKVSAYDRDTYAQLPLEDQEFSLWYT